MEKTLSILFVDDDKFLLDMYALKFSKSNFDVHTAQSGEDALKMIRDGLEPDVLLMDIIMPGINGIEVLEHIRKESLLKNSIIIMLTNQRLPDDIARLKKFNVDGYIIKATTIPSEVLSEVKRIYTEQKLTKK